LTGAHLIIGQHSPKCAEHLAQPNAVDGGPL